MTRVSCYLGPMLLLPPPETVHVLRIYISPEMYQSEYFKNTQIKKNVSEAQTTPLGVVVGGDEASSDE